MQMHRINMYACKCVIRESIRSSVCRSLCRRANRKCAAAFIVVHCTPVRLYRGFDCAPRFFPASVSTTFKTGTTLADITDKRAGLSLKRVSFPRDSRLPGRASVEAPRVIQSIEYARPRLITFRVRGKRLRVQISRKLRAK